MSTPRCGYDDAAVIDKDLLLARGPLSYRAPHLVTSRVGMAKSEYSKDDVVSTLLADPFAYDAPAESADPVTDQLVTRFTGLEDYTNKLLKDVTQFRDAVDKLLSSSNDFATGFTTIFSPIGGESPYEFENKFPNAKATIQHIGEYQAAFDDLKDTIAPELELVDSRVVGPAKELHEYVKKIRKTITKREHKVSLLILTHIFEMLLTYTTLVTICLVARRLRPTQQQLHQATRKEGQVTK